MSVARNPRADGPQGEPAGPAEAPGVLVPPDLAPPLLRVLVRALTREAREDGGTVPPGLAEFLRQLHDATERGPVADDGNDDDAPDTIDGMAMWSTVAQLAAYSGHPPRTLRHWAAAGRVRAVRVGRTWLIDPDSLKEPQCPTAPAAPRPPPRPRPPS